MGLSAKERQQKWRDTHGEKAYLYNRRMKLMERFGITLEEYDELLEKQEGKCAICQRTEGWKGPGGNRNTLHVDHCHKTGKVRGLLCCECNLGISKFHDDPDRLVRASEYVKGSE